MKQTAANAILTSVFAVLLVGCDSPSLPAVQEQQSAELRDDDVVVQVSVADSAWNHLLSLSELEIDSGGSLAEFLAGIERQRLEF